MSYYIFRKYQQTPQNLSDSHINQTAWTSALIFTVSGNRNPLTGIHLHFSSAPVRSECLLPRNYPYLADLLCPSWTHYSWYKQLLEKHNAPVHMQLKYCIKAGTLMHVQFFEANANYLGQDWSLVDMNDMHSQTARTSLPTSRFLLIQSTGL